MPADTRWSTNGLDDWVLGASELDELEGIHGGRSDWKTIEHKLQTGEIVACSVCRRITKRASAQGYSPYAGVCLAVCVACLVDECHEWKDRPPSRWPKWVEHNPLAPSHERYRTITPAAAARGAVERERKRLLGEEHVSLGSLKKSA